jgi:hypothetical protein
MYSLYSQNQDRAIEFFEKFDKEAIKEAIVKHLKQDKTDTIEYCKEFPKDSVKRFYGNQIVDFYEVNPKNDKVSKCILIGEKTFYKSIE